MFNFLAFFRRNQNLSVENEIYTAPTPPLLPGEIVIKEAHRVIQFQNSVDRRKRCIGNLFVTNFKVFLVPTDEDLKLDPVKQSNLLTGDYGICLTNIDALYQVSGNRGRKLFSNTNFTGRIKTLRIVCKNLRVVTYSFELSPYDHGKNIAQTILHHAFPGKHYLLFAYSYKPAERKSSNEVPMFNTRRDWEDEMKRRCKEGSSSWRVSCVNNNFSLCSSLPEWIVVPKSIVDADLKIISGAFLGHRPPTWSWAHHNGAFLVRMADCLPAIKERTQENTFLEHLRGLHRLKRPPQMFELDKKLPSIQDIRISYQRLRELCTPESAQQFETQDSRFHLLLDNSKWLSHVSNFLKVSVECAEVLMSGLSVVLQEGDGRDSSALVSSLIQIMLDPGFRTISGFQSLIQKEWVALGHPFTSRLGFLRNVPDDQASPMFLLFLDCVWQLQQQFDSAFEFSETYLTTLFDSCFISIFDTFLFDCERERRNAIVQENLQLQSVWNWTEQFSEKDINLFFNPLYKLNDLLSGNDAIQHVLARGELQHIEHWTQCYCRWLPSVRISGGGRAQVDLVHRCLRNSIDSSLEKLKALGKKTELRTTCDDVPANTLQNVLTSMADEFSDLAVIDNFHPFPCCDDTSFHLSPDTSNLPDYDSQSLLSLTD